MVHKAWILQKMIVGESDIIVTLFLENGRRVNAHAKSALKRDSKLRAHLEPHRVVEVLLTGNSLKPTLAECVAVASPTTGAQRIYAQQYSMVLDAYGEAMDIPQGIALLQMILETMKKTDDIEKIHTQALHSLLSLAGVAMVLQRCVECGRKESVEWFYGPKNGGVTCDECRGEEDKVLPAELIPQDIAQLLWEHGQFFAVKPLKNRLELA